MKIDKTVYDNKEDAEQLARFAKALGHPIRISIIRHLVKHSSCFTGDLVDVLPVAQSTVSQHLKELKEAGLIQGEVNPPKVKYCIDRKNWAIVQKLFCDFLDIDFNNNQSCAI